MFGSPSVVTKRGWCDGYANDRNELAVVNRTNLWRSVEEQVRISVIALASIMLVAQSERKMLTRAAVN